MRSLLAECNRELTYVGGAQEPVELHFRDAEAEGKEYGYSDPSASGILEIGKQGYGFLRGASFLPSEKDAVVSDKLIERYRLRDGDFVSCYVAQDGGVPEAVQIISVNGSAPVFIERKKFDELPAQFPEDRYLLAGKTVRSSARRISSVPSARVSAESFLRPQIRAERRISASLPAPLRRRIPQQN